MKARIIEKNGFLKPLGLFLIIIILSLTCFVSLAFAKDVPGSDTDLLTDEETVDYIEPVEADAMTASPFKIGL